jgi:lysophospholipase L1-like esterase
MQIIPLQAVPSQTINVVLNNQACQINVYQKFYGIFVDLYVNNVLVVGGVLALNLDRLVRSTYLGFLGDLCFLDTQGDLQPYYTGLGSRYLFVYIETTDILASAAIPPFVFNPGGVITSEFVKTKDNLRFAATRVRFPNAAVNNKSQVMTRSGHMAWVPISALKVGIPSMRISVVSNDLTEFSFNNNATITASVEYPAGVYTQLKFSGSSTGTGPPGQILFSDLLTIPGGIPANAKFWVLIFYQNSSGVYFTDVTSGGQAFAVWGDESSSGTGGLTDKTMTGGITNDGSFCYAPACILAKSSIVSIGCIGDSLTEGVGDNPLANPFIGDIGLVCKTLAALCPMVNLGLGGTTLTPNGPPTSRFWGQVGTARSQLIPYCSDLIIELGTNDLSAAISNLTAAQLIAYLETFITSVLPSLGAAKGVRIFLTTITPHTTSSDGFITIGNQTPDANTAERISYNNSIRGGLPGVTGYYETANVFESSQNSGFWAIPSAVGVNHLLDANDFSSTTAWFISSASMTNSYPDFFGGSNAWRLIEDNSVGPHYVASSAIAQNTTGTFTFSVYASSTNRRLELRAAGASGDFAYIVYDLINGAVGTSGISGTHFTIVSSSIVAVTGGFRCIFSYTCTELSTLFFVLDNGVGNAALSQVYAGDGVSFVRIMNPQFEVGPSVSPWVPGPSVLTNDGLHPNNTGYTAMVSSGIITVPVV